MPVKNEIMGIITQLTSRDVTRLFNAYLENNEGSADFGAYILNQVANNRIKTKTNDDGIITSAKLGWRLRIKPSENINLPKDDNGFIDSANDYSSYIASVLNTRDINNKDVAKHTASLIAPIVERALYTDTKLTKLGSNDINDLSAIDANQLNNLLFGDERNKKANYKAKLKKMHPKANWVLKKFVVPTLITSVVTAGAFSLFALLPIASAIVPGLITDSVLANVATFGTLGAAAGIILTPTIIKLKDTIVRRHYEKNYGRKSNNLEVLSNLDLSKLKELSPEKADELLANLPIYKLWTKIRDTEANIHEAELKNNIFGRIANYFRVKTNRNRIHALSHAMDYLNASAKNSDNKTQIETLTRFLADKRLSLIKSPKRYGDLVARYDLDRLTKKKAQKPSAEKTRTTDPKEIRANFNKLMKAQINNILVEPKETLQLPYPPAEPKPVEPHIEPTEVDQEKNAKITKVEKAIYNCISEYRLEKKNYSTTTSLDVKENILNAIGTILGTLKGDINELESIDPDNKKLDNYKTAFNTIRDFLKAERKNIENELNKDKTGPKPEKTKEVDKEKANKINELKNFINYYINQFNFAKLRYNNAVLNSKNAVLDDIEKNILAKLRKDLDDLKKVDPKDADIAKFENKHTEIAKFVEAERKKVEESLAEAEKEKNDAEAEKARQKELENKQKEVDSIAKNLKGKTKEYSNKKNSYISIKNLEEKETTLREMEEALKDIENATSKLNAYKGIDGVKIGNQTVSEFSNELIDAINREKQDLAKFKEELKNAKAELKKEQEAEAEKKNQDIAYLKNGETTTLINTGLKAIKSLMEKYNSTKSLEERKAIISEINSKIGDTNLQLDKVKNKKKYVHNDVISEYEVFISKTDAELNSYYDFVVAKRKETSIEEKNINKSTEDKQFQKDEEDIQKIIDAIEKAKLDVEKSSSNPQTRMNALNKLRRELSKLTTQIDVVKNTAKSVNDSEVKGKYSTLISEAESKLLNDSYLSTKEKEILASATNIKVTFIGEINQLLLDITNYKSIFNVNYDSYKNATSKKAKAPFLTQMKDAKKKLQDISTKLGKAYNTIATMIKASVYEAYKTELNAISIKIEKAGISTEIARMDDILKDPDNYKPNQVVIIPGSNVDVVVNPNSN